MIEACWARRVETTRREMISRITSSRSWRLSVVDIWNNAESSESRVPTSSDSVSFCRRAAVPGRLPPRDPASPPPLVGRGAPRGAGPHRALPGRPAHPVSQRRPPVPRGGQGPPILGLAHPPGSPRGLLPAPVATGLLRVAPPLGRAKRGGAPRCELPGLPRLPGTPHRPPGPPPGEGGPGGGSLLRRAPLPAREPDLGLVHPGPARAGRHARGPGLLPAGPIASRVARLRDGHHQQGGGPAAAGGALGLGRLGGAPALAGDPEAHRALRGRGSPVLHGRARHARRQRRGPAPPLRPGPLRRRLRSHDPEPARAGAAGGVRGRPARARAGARAVALAGAARALAPSTGSRRGDARSPGGPSGVLPGLARGLRIRDRPGRLHLERLLLHARRRGSRAARRPGARAGRPLGGAGTDRRALLVALRE